MRLAVSKVKRRFFSFRSDRSDLAGMRAAAQSRVVGCGFTGPKPAGAGWSGAGLTGVRPGSTRGFQRLVLRRLPRWGKPNPAAPPEKQKPVEGLVDRILAAKAQLAARDGHRPRVRTVWQMDEGQVAPRLITAYPLKAL